MREIKFRAWNQIEKTMGEPFTLRTAIGSRKCNGIDTDNVVYMQFTGLHDKHGKEIFEGDRVRVGHFEEGDEETRTAVKFEGSTHEIRYFADLDYPAFDLHPHIDCDSNGLSYAIASGEEEIEIIGNIYESPEKEK